MNPSPSPGERAPATRPNARAIAVRVAGVAAAAVVLLAFGRRLAALLPAFTAWVDGLGAWGPVVFVLGYAMAVVAFVPGSILTLAGGALFGLGRGVAYVFTAAVLGATGAFLVARYAARATVARWIDADPRFRAIDRAIAEDGRRIVFLLRLSPALPFTLLNYALGLTRVRLRDYVVGCLGMLPGTTLYVYLGKLGGEVAAAAGGRTGGRSAAQWVLLAVGLAATLAVTLRITAIARRALAEATAEGDDRGDAGGQAGGQAIPREVSTR